MNRIEESITIEFLFLFLNSNFKTKEECSRMWVNWVELIFKAYSNVESISSKLRRMNESNRQGSSFLLPFFIYTSEENRTFTKIDGVESSRWIANVSLYLSIYLSISIYLCIYLYLCVYWDNVHTHITQEEWVRCVVLCCVVFWMVFNLFFERCIALLLRARKEFVR
jgi:hypothetical protein